MCLFSFFFVSFVLLFLMIRVCYVCFVSSPQFLLSPLISIFSVLVSSSSAPPPWIFFCLFACFVRSLLIRPLCLASCLLLFLSFVCFSVVFYLCVVFLRCSYYYVSSGPLLNHLFFFVIFPIILPHYSLHSSSCFLFSDSAFSCYLFSSSLYLSSYSFFVFFFIIFFLVVCFLYSFLVYSSSVFSSSSFSSWFFCFFLFI